MSLAWTKALQTGKKNSYREGHAKDQRDSDNKIPVTNIRLHILNIQNEMNFLKFLRALMTLAAEVRYIRGRQEQPME
jgi:hypothetical protein